MDLFSSTPKSEPLASRMRPQSIEEYAGQEHILGEGRLLRRLIQADRLSSILLYGPPGTGKTTLARVIANTTKSRFITMNAVLTGIKDLRTEIGEARSHQDHYGRRTTLFVDEVHRWNKSQQDALLPWVENGTVILIGATTENPYFEVNPALVSRSRIFQLVPLAREELLKVAHNALKTPGRGYGDYKVDFEDRALEHLVNIANGDARTLLNALELAVETSVPVFPPEKGSPVYVSLESAEESIQKKVLLYDKEGDYHFDTISAFIKSVRGSDPDAALYWLARMIRSGEDPRFIFRRMLISASEDIGLADPRALVIVQSACAAYDRVGMPEGQFHLAQAVLYLATAPKSNSALAYFDALNSLQNDKTGGVPPHLKDASRDSDGFGHGEGYMYPHAYRDHWVAQQYLPTELKGRTFYTPSSQGYEKTIRDGVFRKRELQLEVYAPSSPEILTHSPRDSRLESWIARTTGDKSSFIQKITSEIIGEAGRFPRHARVFIPSPGFGYIAWEILRLVPEGQLYLNCTDTKSAEIITHKAAELDEMQRPLIFDTPLLDTLSAFDKALRFEAILSQGLFASASEKRSIFDALLHRLAPNGTLVVCEPLVHEGTSLSSLIKGNETLAVSMQKAEEQACRMHTAGELDADEYLALFKACAGNFTDGTVSIDFRRVQFTYDRTLEKSDLERWTGSFTHHGHVFDTDTALAQLSGLTTHWTRVFGMYKIQLSV